MPFTFSHPAIVLPLARIKGRFISASALVVGSMAPDFEYFIKMKLSGRFSHTFPGAFLFCLPVAFLVLVIFHLIVKRPLINSLPTAIFARFTALRDFDFIASLKKYPLNYLACLLVGIFSHLLWDSFTHAHHYMVDHVQWLSYPVAIPGLPKWPVFRYLQHVSTCVGGLYIVYFLYRMPALPQINKPNYFYFTLVFLFTILGYAARAYFGFEYLGDHVVSAIGALFLSIIVVSLIFKKQPNDGI
jgi:hypothetical protein